LRRPIESTGEIRNSSSAEQEQGIAARDYRTTGRTQPKAASEDTRLARHDSQKAWANLTAVCFRWACQVFYESEVSIADYCIDALNKCDLYVMYIDFAAESTQIAWLLNCSEGTCRTGVNRKDRASNRPISVPLLASFGIAAQYVPGSPVNCSGRAPMCVSGRI